MRVPHAHMCTLMQVCAGTDTCACTCTCARRRAHACTSTDMCMCVCTCIQRHGCTCVYVCTATCVHECGCKHTQCTRAHKHAKTRVSALPHTHVPTDHAVYTCMCRHTSVHVRTYTCKYTQTSWVREVHCRAARMCHPEEIRKHNSSSQQVRSSPKSSLQFPKQHLRNFNTCVSRSG